MNITHAIVAADASNYPWAVCSCGAAWSYMTEGYERTATQSEQWRMVFGKAQAHVRERSENVKGE